MTDLPWFGIVDYAAGIVGLLTLGAWGLLLCVDSIYRNVAAAGKKSGDLARYQAWVWRWSRPYRSGGGQKPFRETMRSVPPEARKEVAAMVQSYLDIKKLRGKAE